MRSTRTIAVVLGTVAVASVCVFASRAHRAHDETTRPAQSSVPEIALESGAPAARPSPTVTASAGSAPPNRTADGAERERAFQTAAQSANRESLAWLAQMASANDPSATRAATALGSVANRGAAPQLEELAKKSDAPSIVRANAIHALARSGGPENVPYLSDVVTAETEELRLRQEAAFTLGAIGGPKAASALSDALRAAAHDTGPDAEQLRISLVQALGAIGSPESLAALKQYAAGDLSDNERAFVAKYVHAAPTTTH